MILWELLSQRWKKLISFCNFGVEGIDTLNSWKPDLGRDIVVPRGPKGAKDSLVSTYVRMYTPPPSAFRNYNSSQSYGIRNLALYRLEGVQEALGWNRNSGSLHLHEREKFFVFFIVFFYFLKNGTIDFILNWCTYQVS